MPDNKKSRGPYKTIYFWVGIPLTVILATVIGTPHAITDSILYSKLALNLFIGGSIWLWYYRVITFYDQKMPWESTNQTARWARQLLAAMPIALIIDWGGILIRNYILQWPYSHHLYFLTDLPLLILLSIGIHLIFQQLYLSHYRKKKTTSSSATTLEKATKSAIHIRKGKSKHIIPQEEIAYIYRTDQINFLRKWDGQEMMIEESLSTIEKILDKTLFFRINRQLLVNRQAIKSFKVLANRQTLLDLQPPLSTNTSLNKNRFAQFKQWLGPQ